MCDVQVCLSKRRLHYRACKSDTPKYAQPVADLHVRLRVKSLVEKLPEELTGKLVEQVAGRLLA